MHIEAQRAHRGHPQSVQSRQYVAYVRPSRTSEDAGQPRSAPGRATRNWAFHVRATRLVDSRSAVSHGKHGVFQSRPTPLVVVMRRVLSPSRLVALGRRSLSSAARRATAGTLLTSALIQLSLVVTGILAARSLGVEGRGELAFLLLAPRVVVLLGSIGLPLALTYYIARRPDSTIALLRSIASTAFIQAILLVAVTAIILIVGLPTENGDLITAALIILPAVPARLVHVYALGIVQGQKRFVPFNALRASSTVIYAIAFLALFLIGNPTLVTIAIAWTASFMAAAAYGVVTAARGLSVRREQASASRKDMVDFGLKGVLGWVSPIDGLRLDQAIIAFFLSPVALGLYVTAQAFITLPRFVAVSVGSVAYPSLAATPWSPEAQRSWRRYVWFTVALTGGVVGVLSLAAPWIIPFAFGAEFADAVGATRLLLLATFLWGIRRILTDGARGLGLPGLGSLAEISSWVSLVPALAVCVPVWGYDGVAGALVFSSAVSLIVMLHGLARRRRMPFRLRDADQEVPAPNS